MNKRKGLGWYIGSRVLQFVLILLAASVLIFVMCHISKIDPVAVILGGKQTSPETIALLREKFHLNDSRLLVYSHGEYMATGKTVGTFGYSVKKQKKSRKRT